MVINIDGESYRLRAHHAAAEALRRAVLQPANRYTDRCSQEGNADEHTGGLSTSAISQPDMAVILEIF
ncbi:hypothetical protein HMPREF0591_1829 [Mycobacterium parascrofulaceum ATCC BAA-614]|jgi:hypothetical protein|uniref:Uncharacterized protein n=1 Tax=Mycobacterium parascrofulaceum ATCC BAA-614 TaxID=525368 RepID=D5P6N5_9MYCO|nr:hypothetical protein HMPREF0591_1829 [Mycobacterium parascrofulaceum ATCC BAA-614]